MATTNVDIVKVSELTSIERLTDNDRFIVNDHNPADGTVITKTILGTDLAADLGGRITLGELSGVDLEGAVIGNVLKFDGTNWVPAIDNTGGGAGGGIELTDLNAVTLPPVLGQNSTLTYNQYQGIFTFTQPDLRISNMDDVIEQTPTTGQFLRWGGSYWYPSAIDEQALVVENSSVGAGDGSISLEGDVLTYTPPDFSPYLTEETDPIFSQSAAASLTYDTLAQLNELLLPQDDILLGDLGDVNLTGVTTETGMSLYFDKPTQLWTAQYPKPGKLGDLDDVYTSSAENGDIIIYDGAQWRAQPNPTGSVEAGDGLVGGGSGQVVLHVLPGAGIGIRNDAVTLTADLDQLQNVSVSGAQPGDVLFYYGGNSWLAKRPELLGPQRLNDLDDCVVGSPANGEYLRYYNGVWLATNAEELDSGVIEVRAGNGLTGGGQAAVVTLNVGAGPGLEVDSTRVSVRAGGGIMFDENGRLKVDAGDGIKVTGTANGTVALDAVLNDLNNVGGTPSDGQVLSWDNSQGRWEPRTVSSGNITGETGTAGFGLDRSNAARYSISREADNVQGFTASNNGGDNGKLRLLRPAAGQALMWTGSKWKGFTPDAGSTLSAGVGITFNDEQVEITKVDDDKQGLEFSGSGGDSQHIRLFRPAAGEALKWTGSKWEGFDPLAAAQGLTAGFGIDISSGAIEVSTFDEEKQGLEKSSDNANGDIQLFRPAAGQALKWNGNKWVGFTPAQESEPALGVNLRSKDSGGSAHFITFASEGGDTAVDTLYEASTLTYTPGSKNFSVGGGGSFFVINDNNDGIRAYAGGRLEITDVNGLPQITFRDNYNDTTSYDFRLRQSGDRMQLHSANQKIIEAAEDKVTIGVDCTTTTDLRVNGDVEICGTYSQVALPEYPLIGVRMWAKIKRQDSGDGSTNEGWVVNKCSLDHQGFPHITVSDPSGYGIARLNFRHPITQDASGRTIGGDYCVTVTGMDSENDHFFGVKAQTNSYVDVFSKDLENYEDSTGGGTDKDDRPDAFFVSIIF